MSDEKKQGKGFVFVDKRKTQEQDESSGKEKDIQPAQQTQGKAPSQDKKKAEKQPPLPEVDFNFFVLSLSSSAMMQMGVIPNPITQEKEKNLDLAKQTIDIISMLEKKTKGNLAGDEEQFLSSILYDLRLKFVEQSKEK